MNGGTILYNLMYMKADNEELIHIEIDMKEGIGKEITGINEIKKVVINYFRDVTDSVFTRKIKMDERVPSFYCKIRLTLYDSGIDFETQIKTENEEDKETTFLIKEFMDTVISEYKLKDLPVPIRVAWQMISEISGEEPVKH